MKMAHLFRTATISAFLLLTANVAHAGPSSILFVLDSSGSMAGKVGGISKMAIAKQSLTKLLSDLPKNTQTGLMIYGHRERKSCTDVEVVIPLGTASPEKLKEVLQKIVPNGKTPIAYSLKLSSSAFAGLGKSNNNIVLISDGIETCNGDPCNTAGILAKSNINVRIHVIGFDISDKDRKQLECISKAGKGQYFSANSSQGLTTAITKALKVAQVETPAPPPPPPVSPKPKFKEIFRDDFNDEVLAEDWEVINPDTDAYIVEDGFLSILSSRTETLLGRTGKMQNQFRLAKPLPKGNWRITMRIKPGISTFREIYSLALYTDKDNFLSISAYPRVKSWEGYIFMKAIVNKVNKGKNVQYIKDIISSRPNFGRRTFEKNSKPFYDWTNENIKAIQLRIRKTGRSYYASVMVEGEATTAGGKKPKWAELEKLTSLRSPGKFPLFSVGQSKFNNRHDQINGGETLAHVDWIKIETME